MLQLTGACLQLLAVRCMHSIDTHLTMSCWITTDIQISLDGQGLLMEITIIPIHILG